MDKNPEPNKDPQNYNPLLESDENEQSQYKSLVKQIQAEYNLSYKALNSRIQVWLKRLKLLNNQKRDADAVGDNLMFTIFYSVLASLYDDELSAEFEGRNEGNEDTAESLNGMAKFDYDEMEKAIIDYDWLWDTIFFGRGLLSLYTFDRETMTPIPEILDPTTFLRDPEAHSVNGSPKLHRNAARFLGREIQLTKADMEDIPSVFDIEYLKSQKPKTSLTYQAKQARDDAHGLNSQIRYEENDLGVNKYYPVLEWFTRWKHDELTGGKPKKVLVWLGNDRTKVVRFKVLEDQKLWPIIDRPFFKNSHDWDGTSLPDLVEDKQRMRAVLMNLGIKLMKSDLFGMYIFDRNKIKNKGDLNFDFNKFVGVDLDRGQSLNNVVQPMPRDAVNQQYFNLIMNMLDASAQKATATPDMQQGQVTQQDRTLGELNMVNNKVATRYSLTAKVFGWSEKQFWEQWYQLYKRHFKKKIDEKVIKLEGIFGAKYVPLERDDVISKNDPNVKIVSKFLSEAQRNRSRQLFNELSQVLVQYPGTNVRYLLKKITRLHEVDKEEVDRILPPTPDERKAIEENLMLNDDKQVYVQPDDDHEQHLEEHAKAKDTTSKFAHVATHQRALELKKQNPKLFPNSQGQPDQTGQGQPGQTPQQNIQQNLSQLNRRKANQQSSGASAGMSQNG